MRDHPHDGDARNAVQHVDDAVHLDGEEPQTVHPGIDLDVAADVHQLRRAQDLDLPGRVDDGFDIELLKGLDVGRIEKAFKEQDAALPTRLPRTLRVAEVDGRQPVRLLEGAHRVFQPVPVGVRLHHRPKRSARGLFAENLQVVAERLQVDFGMDGTRHGEILPT